MSRGFWDPCHDWLVDAEGIEKPLARSAGDKVLDLCGWDAPPSEPIGPIFGDQRAGDVVAVAGPLLDRMARSHPVAVTIKQQAGEQARLRCSSASVALGDVAGEPRLNGIPQLPIDDRRVFARIGPFLVNDLAPVDAGLQHHVERAARELLTTPEPAGGARPALARKALGVKLLLQQSDRAEFSIAAEDVAHGFRLIVDDDESAVLR